MIEEKYNMKYAVATVRGHQKRIDKNNILNTIFICR